MSTHAHRENAGVDNNVAFVNDPKWFLKLKWEYQVNSAVEEVDGACKGRPCGHKKSTQHKLVINYKCIF